MQDLTSKETEVVEESTEKNAQGAVVVPSKETVVSPPAPVVPVVAPVDYRGKFGMSTRENQVLQGELEALEKQLGEITREEIPTDEEMKGKYPEYEYADSLTQSILKRQEVQDRRMAGVHLNVSRMLGSVSRRNEIAGVAATNPALKGKEQGFLDFAADPKRANAPVETLVSAYLFEVKDEIAPSEVTPPVPVVVIEDAPPVKVEVAPVAALERGNPSGGESPQPTKTEMSAEELKELRTSDPRKYNDMIRRGLI